MDRRIFYSYVVGSATDQFTALSWPDVGFEWQCFLILDRNLEFWILVEESQLWLKIEDYIYPDKQSILLWDGDERMEKFWSDWLELFETDEANAIFLLSLVCNSNPLW